MYRPTEVFSVWPMPIDCISSHEPQQRPFQYSNRLHVRTECFHNLPSFPWTCFSYPSNTADIWADECELWNVTLERQNAVRWISNGRASDLHCNHTGGRGWGLDVIHCIWVTGQSLNTVLYYFIFYHWIQKAKYHFTIHSFDISKTLFLVSHTVCGF